MLVYTRLTHLLAAPHQSVEDLCRGFARERRMRKLQTVPINENKDGEPGLDTIKIHIIFCSKSASCTSLLAL